ncbi:MAG: DJ-1/PfpI family protein [Alphaproteobacteria bacterium]|nr:DJ-1/PfpI family protein [Alphaproteobacteria bacterium]
MTTKLANPSIAILVANGFDENHITAVQRSMTKAGKMYKIIAPEQGLANGWQDNAWGHYFTVDESVSTAMGSDYDVLILIGGIRGVTKLKANLHTRRIVNHFLEAQKPVAAIASGVSLLTLSPKSSGLSVSASGDAHEDLKNANIEVVGENLAVDGLILTADGSDIDAWVEGVMNLVNNYVQDVEAEAA